MKKRRLLAQMAWIMEIIMREDLSNLLQDLCVCCSWTFLTPRNVRTHRNPPVQILQPNALRVQDLRGYCQHDEMKWDLGGSGHSVLK